MTLKPVAVSYTNLFGTCLCLLGPGDYVLPNPGSLNRVSFSEKRWVICDLQSVSSKLSSHHDGFYLGGIHENPSRQAREHMRICSTFGLLSDSSSLAVYVIDFRDSRLRKHASFYYADSIIRYSETM